MYSVVKVELIEKFLNYYNIDYNVLSTDVQAIVVLLSNIFFVLFMFILFYIIYRIVAKFISIVF